MSRRAVSPSRSRSDRMLCVEIVHARPGLQAVMRMRCRSGTTVAEVVRHCGILERFPEIDLIRDPVGIFGERVKLETIVADGDRIEIYRKLIANPKERRRSRSRFKTRASRGSPV